MKHKAPQFELPFNDEPFALGPRPTHVWPVDYQWQEGSETRRGRSVCEGATELEARARFFKNHPHVRPV